MERAKKFAKWLSANWERVIFSVVGLMLLGFSLYQFANEKLPSAGTGFVLAFVCFLFSNLTRFKRVKGWGFEAEMWEDKQKEAADLIERLRGIVDIYTREIVISNLGPNRWFQEREPWKSRWRLFDELSKQHHQLGEKFDTSELKKVMDDHFLYDISMPVLNAVSQKISNGMLQAHEVIKQRFGIASITGVQSTEVREWIGKLDIVRPAIMNPFPLVKNNTLPNEARSLFEASSRSLKDQFGVHIELDDWLEGHLQRLTSLYQRRPLVITEDLIEFANTELVPPTV